MMEKEEEEEGEEEEEEARLQDCQHIILSTDPRNSTVTL